VRRGGEPTEKFFMSGSKDLVFSGDLSDLCFELRRRDVAGHRSAPGVVCAAEVAIAPATANDFLQGTAGPNCDLEHGLLATGVAAAGHANAVDAGAADANTADAGLARADAADAHVADAGVAKADAGLAVAARRRAHAAGCSIAAQSRSTRVLLFHLGVLVALSRRRRDPIRVAQAPRNG
jgi:hypothetical protein